MKMPLWKVTLLKVEAFLPSSCTSGGGMPSAAFGKHAPAFGLRREDLVLGVWGSGFKVLGVWDFGVWGSRCRAP